MDFGGDSTPFFSLFWHGGSPQNSYQTKMSGMVLGRASQIVFFQFGMRFPFKIHARLEGPGMDLGGTMPFFFFIMAQGSPSRSSEHKSPHKSDHHYPTWM